MPAIALLLLLLAQTTPLERLIQTERDFSRTSELKGIKDSFLAYLADDGIIFRPGPVLGKKWISDRPPSPARLTWRPIYADISRAGDLGYTTGPYEFRDGPSTGFGNYFTVWKKQADGSYRFVLDFGAANPQPASPPAEEFPLPPGPWNQRFDSAVIDQAKADLLRLDRKLSEIAAAQGSIAAFSDLAAEDIRVLRAGKFPAVGKAAMRSCLAEEAKTYSWYPDKAEVAASADLGYTYGSTTFKPQGQETTRPGHYVRIWKKQSGGGWRVAIDILN
jgi:ketosteroid isomerase-like protein